MTKTTDDQIKQMRKLASTQEYQHGKGNCKCRSVGMCPGEGSINYLKIANKLGIDDDDVKKEVSKYKWLSWEDAASYCSGLAKKIDSDYHPNAIIGIGLGGNFITQLVAKKLGIKHVGMYNMHSYDGMNRGKIKVVSRPKIDLKGRRVLVTDDISDSGASLKLVVKELVGYRYKVNPKNIRTATIVCSEHTNFVPDYYARKIKGWIVFPWEVDEKGYWD